MTHTTALLAISFYVVAATLLVYRVVKPNIGMGGILGKIARVCFILGLISHTGTLIGVTRDPRLTFLNNGADYFFWGSWLLAAAYLGLSIRVSHPIFGAFLIPAVVLFMGSSSYLLHPSHAIDPTVVDSSSPLLGIVHSIPAMVAVVSLALALAVSLVFLIVERGLKRKGGTSISLTGPSLQQLDRLNRRLIQVGFVAISIVILSGGLWAVSIQKPVFTPDTSVVSGLAVWLLLAALLHVRLVLGWSPRKVSRMTILVTSVFFISVFAVMAFAGRVTHANLVS